MMSDLHIENYDFTIIDFNELLIDNIQHQIINSLYEFNLLEKSINNLSVKKFIFHYTIYGICDKLLDCNTKSIVYFNNTQLDDCELFKYFKLGFLSSIKLNSSKTLKFKLPSK